MPKLTPKPLRLLWGQELLWAFKLAALLLFLSPQDFGQSGAAFQGHVLDRLGSPVADASVTLKSSSQTLETKSDSKGYFEFLAPPATYEFSISARGFETRAIKSFQISQSNRAVTVFLDLGPLSSYDPVVPNKNYKPGERLDVIVMDELGALISNASLTLRSGTNTLRTNSGPDGHFSFAHVRNGRYVLVVAATGFQTKTVEDVQVTREDAVPLRLVLEAPDRP
jgi:uncharacterized GH25 family protein